MTGVSALLLILLLLLSCMTQACCLPFVSGQSHAKSAPELARARITAALEGGYAPMHACLPCLLRCVALRYRMALERHPLEGLSCLYAAPATLSCGGKCLRPIMYPYSRCPAFLNALVQWLLSPFSTCYCQQTCASSHVRACRRSFTCCAHINYANVFQRDQALCFSLSVTCKSTDD